MPAPPAGQFPHKTINHAQGEYVVGAVHTNTIEGFWSIFKRGVVGTFHKVSKKYLPLYNSWRTPHGGIIATPAQQGSNVLSQLTLVECA